MPGVRPFCFASFSLVCLQGLTVFLACGCSQKIDTHSEFVEVAYQHERKGEFPEAVVAYRNALERNPRAAVTWYDLGVAYASMDQFPEAIESYSKAIELDSAMEQAFNNRGAAYARLKQFERALTDCNRAIALNPNDEVALRNRGLAFHDLGDLDKALTDYNESIRINGRNPASYLYRGNVYLERQEWSRALEDFDSAVHLDDKMSAVWLSRAKALASLSRGEEAEKSRETAKQLGADVSDVVLDDLDPSVAPVATTVDPRQQAVDFVQEWLAQKQQDVVAAESPWDLKDAAEQNSVKYVIRLMDSLNGKSDVTFSREELEQISAGHNGTTTLIIVQQVMSEDDTSVKSSFRLTNTLENWTPDFSILQPVAWSLPLGNPDTVGESPESASGATVTASP